MENLIPVAFAIGFPVMWVAVLLLLSHMGGWSRLAAHYPDADDAGTTYHMRSGFIGSVNYKSCLILRVCERGLRFSVPFPFRVGHPPFFVPWDQFHSISEKKVFFLPFLKANVGKPVVASMVLPIWIRDHLPPE